MKHVIDSIAKRSKLIDKLLTLPVPFDFEYSEHKDTRSELQNRKMWAMLRDISRQVEWYGSRMDTESWKHFFSASLKGQKAVPNMDGTGFVVLGISTRKMKISDMCDMTDLMYAFGSDRDVRWSDPKDVINSYR